ncbi:hypothetical protein AOQ84DRAFT_205310, partial [Glonium stellatum]
SSVAHPSTNDHPTQLYFVPFVPFVPFLRFLPTWLWRGAPTAAAHGSVSRLSWLVLACPGLFWPVLAYDPLLLLFDRSLLLSRVSLARFCEASLASSARSNLLVAICWGRAQVFRPSTHPSAPASPSTPSHWCPSQTPSPPRSPSLGLQLELGG